MGAHACRASCQVVASLRIADGVAIVVDTTLGLTTSVERTLQICVIERLPMVLILNQIDRFIVPAASG